MKGKYNIMSFKSFIEGFSTFNNVYKVFMLLSLSGSKLMTRVLYPHITPPDQVSDHKGTVKEKLIKVN
jgi:hypothetical protein